MVTHIASRINYYSKQGMNTIIKLKINIFKLHLFDLIFKIYFLIIYILMDHNNENNNMHYIYKLFSKNESISMIHFNCNRPINLICILWFLNFKN
ncbi:conserved Plasmodium chabaudi protein, unknown function [Plasmodium chabaudi chabaudi]|uniref:Uncharacterized protein n=1 Tax=Plasmodium chabaudi chabaudi TaxID=31271 RepID=A0A4V0K383_PLACU|nr:conserved Plasmodium chabaudi protein, unknown function [Plasmodium chabaudi chabaudi]VTZ66932.1 conserved Plasmodium chabaudi protein, unknown function [Plasmodium chabaudi chabaudi]|eukprot:XP_016653137.1 conserved Plasmodium chabaudi protein, unknown function [Plasmodium chabaudi chabaudi]